ncbi:MAG: FecR domain-containing protein [Saprospiraceae bacterium]|nr:FecR domain-containing protein [Lewinella sp.]
MIEDNLIRKLIEGKCSAEELELLHRYWQEGDQSVIHTLLEKNWEEAGHSSDPVDEQMRDRIWQRVLTAHPDRRPGLKVKWLNRSWSSFLAAAAAVMLLLSIGLWWLFSPPVAAEGQWVEVINEGRKPKIVELADGSTVWLSHQSKMRYPDPFPTDHRPISLVGEAFFEVARDEHRPFTVETPSVKTKVLGTAFNLKAPGNGKNASVALVRGKVAVEVIQQRDTTIVLNPGEQLTFESETEILEKASFVQDAPYAWKDGIIYFQKASVEEVSGTLQKWYGISFNIQQADQIKGTLVYRYDTEKLTLEEALEGISTVMDYSFHQQKNGNYVIRPK